MNRTGHRVDSFLVHFYRSAGGDCTMNGVSSRHPYGSLVQVIDTREDHKGRVVWQADDYDRHLTPEIAGKYPPMRLVIRRIGRDYWHLEPVLGEYRPMQGMAGGSWADLGFRWDDLSVALGLDIGDGPGYRMCQIHDRFETADQMRAHWD